MSDSCDSDFINWNDLMTVKIIGEPIWSSQKRKWYLVTDSALDNASWLDIVDADGKIIRIIEHDLKNYGFMRKKNAIKI